MMGKKENFPEGRGEREKIGLKLQPKSRKYEKLFTLLHQCYCFSDFPLFFLCFSLTVGLVVGSALCCAAWYEILTNTNTAFNWFFPAFFFHVLVFVLNLFSGNNACSEKEASLLMDSCLDGYFAVLILLVALGIVTAFWIDVEINGDIEFHSA